MITMNTEIKKVFTRKKSGSIKSRIESDYNSWVADQMFFGQLAGSTYDVFLGWLLEFYPEHRRKSKHLWNSF